METDNTLYHPAAALVLFKPEGNEGGLYIEYYDMDEDGHPVNPRPLTVRQAQGLSKALDTSKELAKAFLRPTGIVPQGVLHFNPAEHGSVVWYTRPMRRRLYFVESLGLPNTEIPLPALVWAADRRHLSLYALKGKSRPTLSTPLFRAPFMNLYENGNVCMGNVDVRIAKAASLEAFMAAWEDYFFGSYFSHLIGTHSPVAGDLTALYRQLIQTGGAFPVEQLTAYGKTLKHLLP